MTSQDHRKIAGVFARAIRHASEQDMTVVKELVHDLAIVLMADNSRFNEVRFLEEVYGKR